MKEQLRSGKSGIVLRNLLVILQFTISIGLISATLLVFSQMSFLQNRSLGFEKKNRIVIENAFGINNDQDAIHPERFVSFRSEVVRHESISEAGYTSAMPGDILNGFIVRVPGSGEKESMVTRMMSVSTDFFPTMNIEILEGRGFSSAFNDSLSIILSAKTVEQLGMTDPVGKKIIHVANDELTEYNIIGIVKDFYFQSLHVELEPMAITSHSGPQSFINKMVVAFDPSTSGEVLEHLESMWSEFVPDTPFQYYFLDNDLDEFYVAERASGQLFSVFTFLAILIACIGLLGLSSYVINQKTKEIGIRKVLGASVSSIVLLLIGDFSKLILIAAAISIPLIYLWMNSWLDNFAYHVEINWALFLLSGMLALLVGIFTVSIQTAWAALANPVKSLRTE